MLADPASPPAWASADAYRALLTADPAVWAWEFARRAGARPADDGAQKTRFGPCYVGPGPTGQSAPAVIWPWEVDATVPLLSVRTVDPGSPDALDLHSLGLPVMVVRREAGDQHVLVVDGERRLRFAVVEGDVLRGASACFASLTPSRGGATSLEGLRQLMTLQACGRLPRAPAFAVNKTPKWLAALQAYDARRAGASQRDIARLMFGERRVVEDWNGRSDYMRLRVHRLLGASERLVAGGYRALFGLTSPPRPSAPIVEVWRSTRWLASLLIVVIGAGPLAILGRF